MMSFLLAILLHPELQRKAQDEIDAVTGRARFPTFEDRPRLPFVDALCKEVLRWRPAAPLRRSNPWSLKRGVYICLLFTDIPHTATEDRVYEGFFIPKGAIYCRTNPSICLLMHVSTRCLVDRKYMV